MNSQKICRSIQVATLSFAIPLFATASFLHFEKIVRLVPTNKYRYIADGGAPVPPYPPKPPVAAKSNQMIADGGAPVPPYPKPPAATTTRT